MSHQGFYCISIVLDESLIKRLLCHGPTAARIYNHDVVMRREQREASV